MPGLIVCKDCAVKQDRIVVLENTANQNVAQIQTLQSNLEHALAEIQGLKMQLEIISNRQISCQEKSATTIENAECLLVNEKQPTILSDCCSYYSVANFKLPNKGLTILVDEISPTNSAESPSSLKSCLKQSSPNPRKGMSIGFDSKSLFYEIVTQGTVQELNNFLEQNPGFNIACAAVTGLSALHYAVMASNAAVLSGLFDHLELRMLINATEDEGWTPLHFAAISDSVDVAQLLVENGANIEYKNNDGKCPIEVAEENCIIEYLNQALQRKLKDNQVVCLHNWTGQEDDEITAHIRETLDVVDRGDNVTISEWWYVRQQNGKEGFIPRSYVGCIY